MKIGKFCAHRGVPFLAEENTIASFEAAYQLGAEEIEFDVRLTKDNQLIVAHNREWGVDACTPADIFAKFANKMDFNIHIKHTGENGYVVKELLKLIEKYDAAEHVYFAGSYYELPDMVKYTPHIRRVAIQWIEDEESIVDKAKKFGCWGAQLWLGMFDEETIRQLHKENIRCNLCFADDVEGFQTYFKMGADVILTNRMDLAAKFRKGE